MGQIEDLQNKGFGSHGGKQYTVDNDITPLKKRVWERWESSKMLEGIPIKFPVEVVVPDTCTPAVVVENFVAPPWERVTAPPLVHVT